MEKKTIERDDLEEGMLSAKTIKTKDGKTILRKLVTLEDKHMNLLQSVGINEIEVLIPDKINYSFQVHINDYPQHEDVLFDARIMIVDDSKTIRYKLNKLIVEAGFDTIIEAFDGQEAVEKVEEFKPTFITMDIEMPRMDGITAVEKIHEKHPDIKIVMISSQGQEGQEDKIIDSISAGALDFIHKPFDPDKVKKAIITTIITDFLV